MDAQDQPIGPRVFWTIGFLALGTLSAIGAAALFPWYLAVAIAILVTGMASACAFQFRVTKNYLYLIAMLAMTGLASFLDGVSVWELLNKRQNTELRGVQAQETVTQDQLKNAEQRANAVREEIATLTAEAENMNNDGKGDNDRLIPGVLAKIESKKADLANFETKAEDLRAKALTAASTSAVSDAGRHVLLQLADRHANPAQWLIAWASLVFCLPELTLALLAWSLRDGKRANQLRPQPVVIVSASGAEGGQASTWQTLPVSGAAMTMPQMAFAYPQATREASAAMACYAPPAPVYAAPALPPAPVEARSPARAAAAAVERVTEPANAPQAPLGMGQMMMMAATSAPVHAAADSQPEMRCETAAKAVPFTEAPQARGTVMEAAQTMDEKMDEEVMLSPESVPEQEFGGSSQREIVAQSAETGSGRERVTGTPGAEAAGGDQVTDRPTSVLEAARNRNQEMGKPSPTKMAKHAAAKRSKKGGMRSRGTSLAELASRLN